MQEKIRTIQIWGNKEDEFEVGDIIGTTTSEFEYNNITERFENNLKWLGEVKAVWIDGDYNEYDPSRCNNGGCYGYDYYVITEVLRRAE